MKLNSLEVLSKKDIGLIHENSLKILGNIGIKVDSIEIIEILRSNGCLVDDSSMIVRFPEKVINRCLGSLPEKVRLIDRNGRTAVMLGDGGRYCASGHNAVFTMIDETGARREAKLKDVEQFAILSEHLRDVDVAGIPYSPQDVPAKTALLYSLRTMIENTIKPVFYSCESGMINEAALEMSRTLIGKRDLREGSYLISQLSTTSPLYWERCSRSIVCMFKSWYACGFSASADNRSNSALYTRRDTYHAQCGSPLGDRYSTADKSRYTTGIWSCLDDI